MLLAIAETLPLSLGVALSPVPVAVALLLLPTGEQPNRAPALLLGWILAVLLVVLVVLLAPGLESPDGVPTKPTGYLRLVLGIALLVLAARQWKLRAPPGSEPELPPLIGKLTRTGSGRVVFLGALLFAANPMNLLLVAAAANILDTSMLDPAEQTVVVILFTAGAGSSIALPVIGYWLLQDRARLRLGYARDWLLRHNTIIVTSLLLAFGMLLVVSGTQIALEPAQSHKVLQPGN